MKLSEAIRLGAMLAPQGFGKLRDKHGGLCALGAAYGAAGILDYDACRSDVAERTFPVIVLRGRACPVCGIGAGLALADLVTHLNDAHEWTREAIADYVETIEAQQPEIATPTAVSVEA